MDWGASSENSPGSLAAEAAALTRPRSCDGADSHTFGWSARRRAQMVGGSLVLVLLAIVAGPPGRAVWVPVGLALGAVLSAGFSVRVEGPLLVANRFGFVRRVPLADITRVERYAYRSSVSLRLWLADGSRAPSIPTKALAYRLDPIAAAHLLRYLDGTGVSWGPGAWETVTADLPRVTDPAPGPSADKLVAGPRGRRVPGKPLSGWRKGLAYLSALAFVTAVVALLVVTPLSWLDYAESQRIQHGPMVIATLLSESVSAESDRYGTHHTTHFQVAFTTASGRPIRTVVDAHGRYDPLPIGDRFGIRYDPGAPSHAELPGAPIHTLGPAIWLTVITLVLLSILLGLAKVGLKVRTLRRRVSRDAWGHAGG